MSEPLTCINHPKVETYLRCNRCNEPICTKCAIQTPVGYRCPDCVRNQQKVFYTDFRPIHYLIAAIVALPLSLIAGWLIPSLGWFAIILGPLAGGAIANVTHWAIGRRRGQYTWLVVCGSIVATSLLKLLLTLGMFLVLPSFLAGYGGAELEPLALVGGLMGVLWDVVYLVTAVGAAYAWLRPSRRR